MMHGQTNIKRKCLVILHPLSSLLPCSHLPLIRNIIHFHVVVKDNSSTCNLSVLVNVQHCIHSVFVSTVDTGLVCML